MPEFDFDHLEKTAVSQPAPAGPSWAKRLWRRHGWVAWVLFFNLVSCSIFAYVLTNGRIVDYARYKWNSVATPAIAATAKPAAPLEPRLEDLSAIGRFLEGQGPERSGYEIHRASETSRLEFLKNRQKEMVLTEDYYHWAGGGQIYYLSADKERLYVCFSPLGEVASKPK